MALKADAQHQNLDNQATSPIKVIRPTKVQKVVHLALAKAVAKVVARVKLRKDVLIDHVLIGPVIDN